jgi:hypothetical protein
LGDLGKLGVIQFTDVRRVDNVHHHPHCRCKMNANFYY